MKSKNAKLLLTGITHMMWAKDLFEDVNMEVVWGQVVWLIWPNGVWKSTLLKIMSGLIEPRAGTVEVEWQSELLSQWLEANLLLSVYEYIQQSRKKDGKWPLEEREVLTALSRSWGKEIDVHMPLSTLSWWERTTVRIAKCLIDNVDILLLDEPTNHLDRDGIAYLQWVVKKFRGPVVIVSHDRQFLDDVCTDIFDLRRGKIEQYEGTYTQYIKERQRKATEHMKEREEQQEEKEKAEKSLEALHARSSFRGSASIGWTVRSRKKYFDRRFVDGKIEKVREDYTMNMEIEWWEDEGKEVLTLGKGIIWWVDKNIVAWDKMKPVSMTREEYEMLETPKDTLFEIAEPLNLQVKDRIVIVGKNWSGKTTLLKILHQSSMDIQWWSAQSTLVKRWEDIRVWWFDQHDESLAVDIRVMKWCLDTFPAGWDQAMITEKLAGANIPEEDLMKKMSDLSHGQRMKIRFLQLMLHSYDLLVLDEPTNHLDIGTREELEIMLQQYEGAILVVSHDRWFVEKIRIQTKWRIREEKMEVLPWKKKYSDKGK